MKNSSLLGQYVAETHIAHAEVGVLRRTSGYKPGAAGDVRGLGDQQDCPVLRVLPEGLGPVNCGLLNGAVGAVGRVGGAKSGKASRKWVASIKEEIALGVHAAVIHSELAFGGGYDLKPAYEIAGVNQ